jgi:integrase/recombinase XerD
MATKRKAPAGCYWRERVLWGRVKVNGRDIRWSLHTDNPAIARARREAGKARAVADAFHGDAQRTFLEAMEGWAPWIKRRVRPKAVKRYACSLDQLRDWIEDKKLMDINGRLIADIVRDRGYRGASNATIKRDLVALSSVMNFAMDQGWIESNPVLPRMKRVKERRDPIVLPAREHVAVVIQRAPGMIKQIIEAAIRTGARQEELLSARREHVDHERRQLTLIGKRGKVRVIDLNPFDGYDLFKSLPAYMGKPFLFWHSDGENYKTFASQFLKIMVGTAKWASANGVEFRRFRFHDLRHLHAVEWLKSGRSIYDLQRRLGHTSIATTEGYCVYLTAEEERAAKLGLELGKVSGGA